MEQLITKNDTQNVPKGYKQTEVGLIPEDWVVRNLTYLVDYFHGKAHENYISDNGKYIVVNSKYISTEGITIKYSKENFCPAKKGDVLTVLSDIPNGKALAKCFLVDKDDTYAVNQRICIWRTKNVDPIYLYYKLNRHKYFLALNDGVNQTNIGNSDIEKCKVGAPPTLTEQRAIATVLSDTDALIQALEKKIAKKKSIKKGVMQELLTPKEGWVETTLGEIAEFLKGKGLPKSEIKETGKHKCIHYGELFTTYKEDIRNVISRTNKSSDYTFSKANDVLMPTSDVTPNGLATASSIKEDNVILGGDVLIIRIPKSIVNGTFLSYCITKNRVQVMKLVTGTTVYHLYGSDMAKFILKYPKIEEQNQIAQILSDMDKEIENLEQKLSKYQLAKQGMMQELLTGKIRLV